MKKAFHIKIAVLITAFTVLASAMIAPALCRVSAKPDNQLADVTACDKTAVYPISDKTNTAGSFKASGDGYELPFIPAETEHDWDNGTVTTPPTCTEPGVKTYTCKLNSKHTYTEVIPATGHTPTNIVAENEIAPTCETAGARDDVIYCAVCGAQLSRNHTDLPALGHDWGEWVLTTEPTETQPGEETRTCKNDPSHTETREVPPLEPAFHNFSFFDSEIILIVPNSVMPDNSKFEVIKIVPPPAEVTEKVKSQMSTVSEVISYYEIRLYNAEDTPIIHLDGEITVKTKMPEQYVGSGCIKILQEDENGKLIVMQSRWEDEYLCYNTDWLEIYD